jgi:hypothetical protein
MYRGALQEMGPYRVVWLGKGGYHGPGWDHHVHDLLKVKLCVFHKYPWVNPWLYFFYLFVKYEVLGFDTKNSKKIQSR